LAGWLLPEAVRGRPAAAARPATTMMAKALVR